MKHALMAAAAFCGFLEAFPAWAGPSGNGFEVPNSGMISGGGVEMQGGAFRAAGSMGGAGTVVMRGGGFAVAPGILVSQRPAQDDLNLAHAFPVPYIPSKGHREIVFTRLTAKVTIRIYTISGELVKTLLKDSGASDELAWQPVHNDSGAPIASGVYIFHVESTDGKTKIGKLMVIK